MWAALTKNGHPSKLWTAAIHLYTSKQLHAMHTGCFKITTLPLTSCI